MELNTLCPKPKYKRTRVGRGVGSGLGKTCGRGEKGAGSRSGYKRRHTYEGGQMRLFRKLPVRGFSRARFREELDHVNILQIEQYFNDGDVVNLDTLRACGLLNGPSLGVKLLAYGETTKKVTVELTAFSKSAMQKLDKAGIKYTTV